MKRRLMIARALVHEPRVLILDEPTAGVDIEMRRSMYDFLRETNDEGRTIILTTHYLEEAEMLCRNVGIINQGKIVTDGAIRDLLRDLNSETFLLDTQEELPSGISIPGYQVRQVEPRCLRSKLKKDRSWHGIYCYGRARRVGCQHAQQGKSTRADVCKCLGGASQSPMSSGSPF